MNDVYLAFDLGAESGRGVTAEFDGNKLSLTEAGRFPTTRDSKDPGPDGVWRWDYRQIVKQIQAILTRIERDQRLSGVAVDTWGVDFGLLDASGTLIEEPVCYRDDSHLVAMNEMLTRIPAEDLWSATGIQLLPFNTLYQLRAAQVRNAPVLEQASRLLFMPDLLASGLLDKPVATSELTIASTSQLLDPTTRTWNRALIERAGLPSHFLQPIVEPGTLYGTTAGGTVVRATAGHDTASAVAATPAEPGKKWAFLSSGTWSLLGVERSKPELSIEAFKLGLSNEIGVLGTTRLLKNIMGLWLVQESRRSLARSGQELSYSELTSLAAAAPDAGPLVDAADRRFLAPADMPSELRNACAQTGQTPPESTGELIRCALDSLALAYRRTLLGLESVLGEKYDVLHIIGGGTQNKLLNQLAADATGVPVVAGPAEATAVGNVLAQMVGRGVLSGYDQARAVCRNSFQPETFLPNPSAHQRWIERDQEFLSRTGA
ncbi:MAG: rhamnulokinase [Capsulimonadaceae bacterium]|nr:rhamnulokinase [Capsulimonadaceae bacterium]